MLCPHCGFDNPDGRKYCRGCAKPLATEAAPSRPVPPVPVQSPVAATAAPVVSKMAIASLGLSFMALFPPLGIAALVMGHVSRRQIATSQGRQTGMGIAFAGLILSYLQLFIVGVLFVVLIGLGYEMNQKLDHDRYVRAALVERIVNGDPDHPSAAVMAKNGENLLDALHLTEARQDAYRDEHGGNNACDLNYLEPLGRDDELTGHVRNSHYAVKLICTGADDQGRAAHYAVTAYPLTESNPPNAPIYCLDESKIIRRYSNENDLNAVVSYQRLSCPEDGQPVQ